MLYLITVDDILYYIVFLLENSSWNFMQSVSLGYNLIAGKYQVLLYRKIVKKYNKMSLEFAITMPKVNLYQKI